MRYNTIRNKKYNRKNKFRIIRGKVVNMKNYKVVEDNGGGLTLVVFAEDTERIEYIHNGYEYNPGQLSKDIESLKNGDDPANEWEGNDLDDIDEIENPEEFESWFPWVQKDVGWKVVADNDGIYPEDMGSAAMMEFLTEKED